MADARSAAAGANQFVANLDAQKDDINQIVASAKLLAERLNDASTQLDKVLGKADTLLTTTDGEGGTQNFFQEATKAAQAIREAAEGINKTTDQVSGDVTKFSSRGLSDLTTLINELRATAARVDRLVTKFEQNPAGAVLGGNSGVREYNRR